MRPGVSYVFLCLSCRVSDNYIDGQEFMKLTETEVKEMVPPIGLAKKILRMIPKVCANCKCGERALFRTKIVKEEAFFLRALFEDTKVKW